MVNYSSILHEMKERSARGQIKLDPMEGQIRNNAGGHYREISDWDKLDRFLILGSDSGTYYVDPKQLTKDNLGVVMKLRDQDAESGVRVVNRILTISKDGRAPKNDAAILALACMCAAKNDSVRSLALTAIPQVCRTGTHLLMFVGFVKMFRGFGRGLRSALGRWFTEMSTERLSLQAIKYNQRNGWSLRDVLRLAHAEVGQNKELIAWIAHPEKTENMQALINCNSLMCEYSRIRELANLTMLATGEPPIEAIVRSIVAAKLPREAVPTELLNNKEVWRALLDSMPMTAMIRNLGKMTAVGLLEPFAEAAKEVAVRLIERDRLKSARIHPMQILLALKTYASGKGDKGKLEWSPNGHIVTALNDSFDMAFYSVEPTGKRILAAVDVSGSMNTKCSGNSSMTATEAAAAMALILVRSESNVHTIAFDTYVHEFPITKSQRLDDVVNAANRWGGGTDLSQPILYALHKQMFVDAFVLLTDNETWAGKAHCEQVLELYRRTVNPAAKLVVAAFAANSGSVINPSDPLSFGICGLDASVPQLVSDFIRGE